MSMRWHCRRRRNAPLGTVSRVLLSSSCETRSSEVLALLRQALRTRENRKRKRSRGKNRVCVGEEGRRRAAAGERRRRDPGNIGSVANQKFPRPTRLMALFFPCLGLTLPSSSSLDSSSSAGNFWPFTQLDRNFHKNSSKFLPKPRSLIVVA